MTTIQEMEVIAIDSCVGGMGDVWMRLSALYTLAALIPEKKIQLRIPKPLIRVAQLAWPDRFQITSEALPHAIVITHLGLRHLVPRLIKGQQFLSPFYQILRADREAPTLKHKLNDLLVRVAKVGGNFHVPTAESVSRYQGYHECSAIFDFSNIAYESFLKQAGEDFTLTRSRLQAYWPKSDKPAWRVIVLPSGTGHQIMPPDWALANLPEATYAFFAGDSYKAEFTNRGLKIVEFGDVESLLQISSQAKFAIVTDSFPSHPLQAYSSSTIAALSQQPWGRIVHPAFDGRIIHSNAPCSPCANRARGMGKCDAGFDFCTTWRERKYTEELLASLE